MKWFINYLRECFCKHEFDRREIATFDQFSSGNRPAYYTIHLECKKCGFHKKYKM
jgi:hypothetical protein